MYLLFYEFIAARPYSFDPNRKTGVFAKLRGLVPMKLDGIESARCKEKLEFCGSRIYDYSNACHPTG